MDQDFVIVQQALEDALAQLRKGTPKPLLGLMKVFASTRDEEIPDNALESIFEHLRECGPNDRTLHALIFALQSWDHSALSWCGDTSPHTPERRSLVLTTLGFGKHHQAALNARVLIAMPEELPVVIAEEHEDWYYRRRHEIIPFYWQHYADQLMSPAGRWSAEAVATLETSVDDVIDRLSDPTRTAAYGVRGLVMGYVQSGKTSHFAGLIGKASDAGYRLIVVLAGTLDILRQQTQRRIDKHVVGRELLPSEEYQNDSDWSDFVSHGARPSDLGRFDWRRLTDRSDDYASLRKHLQVLHFACTDKTKPFNHPDNLRAAEAKLIVLKKTPSRLQALCNDLEKLTGLRTQLEQVPTLVIDDESDQASINTIKPENRTEKKGRTGTNAAIVRLLALLPRAQYVGYTATPFANVFVDPEDAADLFPRNFIISLPRPDGYMGASDFYDFNAESAENDYKGNRNAFVRSVEGANTAATNLPQAVDAFVLSGAIKLYRQSVAPAKYRFRHHTMLVHHNAARVIHEADAEEVRSIYKGGARYQKAEGIKAVSELFEKDYLPVSRMRAAEAPMPSSFDDLRPFIAECVTRVNSDKAVRIVNGEGRNKDDTPDFEQNDVWAILVGGTKLSRGYTVEGLTISYYRRVAGAGDSLMQMGRWFGFRKGYVDLVRLFIGTKETKGITTVDLYETFGAVCRDEEALREDLLKYSKHGLTPRQVPPLVRQHASHLPPTSKNKMFNAEIESQDMSGEWGEKTVAPPPSEPKKIVRNLATLCDLLSGLTLQGPRSIAFTATSGKNYAFETYVADADGADVLRFLVDFKWRDKNEPMRLTNRYVAKELSAGRLTKWCLLLPQSGTNDMVRLPRSGLPPLARISRNRLPTGRYNVYSEPRHVDAAAALAGVRPVIDMSSDMASLIGSPRPVIVVYLVTPKGGDGSETSVGFGLHFPGEKAGARAITWTVRDKRNANSVVVDAV